MKLRFETCLSHPRPTTGKWHLERSPESCGTLHPCRHWKQLMRATGVSFASDSEKFCLGDLLVLRLHEHSKVSSIRCGPNFCTLQTEKGKPQPEIRKQKPETWKQKPKTWNLKPETRNPEPQTWNPNPQHQTRNSKPEPQNSKPKTRYPNPETIETLQAVDQIVDRAECEVVVTPYWFR